MKRNYIIINDTQVVEELGCFLVADTRTVPHQLDRDKANAEKVCEALNALPLESFAGSLNRNLKASLPPV